MLITNIPSISFFLHFPSTCSVVKLALHQRSLRQLHATPRKANLWVKFQLFFSDFATTNLVFGVVNGLSLAFAPLVLVPLIGSRAVAIVGSICYCLGYILTYWTIDQSLGLVIFTYGVIQSLGNMALIPTYTIPMR